MIGGRAKKLYEKYRDMGKQRMRAGGGDHRSEKNHTPSSSGVKTFTHPVGKSRDHVGAAVGVSGPTGWAAQSRRKPPL